MKSQNGKVYLVGAGPGDAGLITVRGVECLAEADVIVYDHLANLALLVHAKPGVEIIFAGKEPGHHAMSQEETNELLVDRARAGRVVTRLKGGDPFVFGRGGEEAMHLAENGIEFEVVPGVTSAIAVPAFAGIPVTHRDMNLSLHIIAGHDKSRADAPDIAWDALARLDGTLVFLMGVKNLPRITQELIRNGKSPDTPAALVRWGTLPEQETLVSTLGAIVEEAGRTNFLPPAMAVIGPVVGLRSAVRWAEKRPLFGIRAAVTRPANQSASLADGLRRAGADVWVLPTIATEPRQMSPEIRKELTAAPRCQWVLFTSANAVSCFFALLGEMKLDARHLKGVRVGAIGDRTAEALRGHGIVPDAVPATFVQEKLAAAVAVESGQRVLLPRAGSGRENLERELKLRGADVRVVPVYDTVGDRHGIAALRHELTQGRIHLATFTSASTFERFAESVKAEDLPRLFSDVTIATIGPITTAAVKAGGLEVDIEASRHTADGMVEEILSHFRKNRPARAEETWT